MDDLMITLATNFGIVVFLVTLLWIISIPIRDVSIVDPFWGTGFVVIAWSTWLLEPTVTARNLLLVGMVTVWGLRLSIYLLWRNLGHGEDKRYANMRKRSDPGFWWKSLPIVFLLQGVLMWIISMPVQIAQRVPPIWSEVGWLDAMGVILFLVGFAFESIGDWQLARFKRDPENKGKVLDSGLWRYTRHPNYFGDFCVWWGIYLVAVAGGAWWTFFGPAIMSIFLMRVSGVTLLERDIEERRPAYAEYKRTTSTFFPWPPKSPA